MKTAELLFPKVESTKASLLLLASRLVFGLTFASHGLEKLQHFTETAAHFPAPFGLSGEVAVGLSIFGELVCGLAFVFGFLTRLTLLPMIFTMIVAFTTVHGGSVSGGEVSLPLPCHLSSSHGSLVAGRFLCLMASSEANFPI